MHTLISDVTSYIFKFLKYNFITTNYEIARTCEIEDSKRQTPNRPQSSVPSHALMSHVVTSCETAGF